MDFKSELKTYGLQCVAGSKTTGVIEVEGTPVRMPVTLISGTQEGRQILITGGVHGGEYPGIETAIRLANQLNPQDVSGDILIIHPVNTPAFLARMQYYGPYDGKNLNRVFPGKAKGSVSERIAYAVNKFQQCADFYIDLHGGDIHESLVPFVIYSTTGEETVTEESRQASALMGLPYVVGSSSVGGSIAGAAVSGTPGFLAELGQCGRWNEQEVDQYQHAVKNVLRYLKSIEGQVEQKEVQYIDRMIVTTTQNEGCWYPSIELEEIVTKGQKLGEVRDFFGQTLSEYYAEGDGRVLYVVTSLAITTGDPLVAIGA